MFEKHLWNSGLSKKVNLVEYGHPIEMDGSYKVYACKMFVPMAVRVGVIRVDLLVGYVL